MLFDFIPFSLEFVEWAWLQKWLCLINMKHCQSILPFAQSKMFAPYLWMDCIAKYACWRLFLMPEHFQRDSSCVEKDEDRLGHRSKV